MALRIYKMTCSRPLREHVMLSGQIARAGVGVPANVAEGYGLGTTGQLVRCRRIAYGSCLALGTHLWIAGRAGALPSSPSTARAAADVARVTRMLVGLLKHRGARVGA